jgi:hypothetical protein
MANAVSIGSLGGVDFHSMAVQCGRLHPWDEVSAVVAKIE